MSDNRPVQYFMGKSSYFLGVVLWFLAFILSTVIMMGLGIDFSDPDLSFGPQHPKYWLFELFMVPLFLLLSGGLLVWYFKRSDVKHTVEAIMVGVVIMFVQFVLDILVLVYVLGSGWVYFAALVTVSYLMIPIWSYLFFVTRERFPFFNS